MSDRSLIATEAGIKLARIALTGKKLTQEKLGLDLGITRSTVSNFFAGKPIDRQIFVTICENLEINWQEISEQLPSIDIEALVMLARERCAEGIQKRCGTMRVLNMEQPIALNEICTGVNILEKLTRNQRRDLNELMEKCRVEEFYRWGLGGVQQKRVGGIEAVKNHSKLMILGKPGAGKTTFLKFLAMSCINGYLFEDRVPIFVTLKDFADEQKQMSLSDYIVTAIAKNRIAEELKPNMPPLWINWESNKKASEHLVQYGKLLILLDGLDEVREKDDYWILKEIREFAQRYDKSQIVVTCRIAAKQYIFEQFTEVEVADFDKQQIATFTENWFRPKEIKGEDFLG